MAHRLDAQTLDHMVRYQCERFTERTGIPITDHARSIISTLIDAILRDPHPLWVATDQSRDQFAADIANRIPELLSQLVNGPTFGGVVSTYDVVHLLAEKLYFLCVIEKRRYEAPAATVAR